jgi:NAD(P)-dependent dehydrogenase (short-subunit alcohol dehydrogenase family)
VAPGYIETAINAAGRTDRAHYQRIADRTAFKWWGRPEDIAGAFLCMPTSHDATGTVVAVDGGFLAS